MKMNLSKWIPIQHNENKITEYLKKVVTLINQWTSIPITTTYAFKWLNTVILKKKSGELDYEHWILTT